MRSIALFCRFVLFVGLSVSLASASRAVSTTTVSFDTPIGPFSPQPSPWTLTVTCTISGNPSAPPAGSPVKATFYNASGVDIGNGEKVASVSTTSGMSKASFSFPIPANFQGTGLYIKAYFVGFGNGSGTWSQSPSQQSPLINIDRIIPSINWAQPADINYGTLLTEGTGGQLNASATDPITHAAVSGSFVYSPVAGTRLNAGLGQPLSASFTPTNMTTYAPVSGGVSLNVNKATATLSYDPASTSQTYTGGQRPLVVLSTPSGIQTTVTYKDYQTFDPSTHAPVVTTNPPVDVGSYDATVTAADSNYQATSIGPVRINIAAAQPTVIWGQPGAINYGTPLGSTQLNAAVLLGGVTQPATFGSLFYTLDSNHTVPASGVVLGASDQEQSLYVIFTPNNSNYAVATGSTTIKVNRLPAGITWLTPNAITYGTALSTGAGGQLNATADTSGTFTYSPIAGTVLDASSTAQSLSATFVPEDANHAGATVSVNLLVNKATPKLNWSKPADMTYGAQLTNTQLNAQAVDPTTAQPITGTYTYSPAIGSIVNTAGDQTLSVTFTPTNTAAEPHNTTNYNANSQTVVLHVNKRVPTITATNLIQLYDGTVRAPTITVDPSDAPVVIKYRDFSHVTGPEGPPLIPNSGQLPNAGGPKLVGGYGIRPSIDASNPIYEWPYDSSYTIATLEIKPAKPHIDWNRPADISYGQVLTTAQLNATSPAAGNDWVYSPNFGAMLAPGTDQTLSVTFTPFDTVNYVAGSATTQITVKKTTPVCAASDQTWAGRHTISSSDLAVSFDFHNPFSVAAAAPTGTRTYVVVSASSTGASPTGAINPNATVLDPGTYLVQASYGGDDNYNAVTATSTFTITSGALTGTFLSCALNGDQTALSGTGWAADPDTGHAVAVEIKLDGAKISDAQIAQPSPVGAPFSDCGWSFGYNFPAVLTVGSHTLEAFAYRADGARVSIGLRSFTVTVGTASNPPGLARWSSTSGSPKILSGHPFDVGVVLAPLDFTEVYSVKIYRNGSEWKNVGNITGVGGTIIGPFTEIFTGNQDVSYTVEAQGSKHSGYVGNLSMTVRIYEPDSTAPTAPGGLVADSISLSKFTLRWNASPDPDVHHYVIGVGDLPNPVGVGTVDAAPAHPATYSFVYDNLAEGTKYKMSIMAFDWAGNNSSWSTPQLEVTTTVTDRTPPSIPGRPVAMDISAIGATIRWGESADEVNGSGLHGYTVDVYKDGATSPLFSQHVGAGITAQVVTGLTAGTHYRVVVQATDNANNSSTNETTFDTEVATKPYGLASTNVTDKSFRLTWSEFTIAPATEHYVVQLGATGPEIAVGWDESGKYAYTSHIFYDLNAATSYQVRVKALNSTHGASSWSEWFTVTTDDPLIDKPAVTLPAGSGDIVAGVGGDLAVDNHGDANYSIPLQIAPGRGGFQPSISLNYSSGAGNGPLGVGFSLATGFPQAITRGRSISARDGEVRGVEFSSADKFYLDGKRLICTNTDSHVYGQPGSTYRTEVDSFLTITTTGSGSNIETFVATDKSGVKFTFGKSSTPAGSIETDGYQHGGGESQALAYAYALKRVEDPLGNFVSFSYEPVGGGEYLLSSIKYTGGPDAEALAKVAFSYETTRPDQPVTYLAGRAFNHRGRLRLVTAAIAKTSLSGAPSADADYDVTAQYGLTYGQDPAFSTISIGRSRLTQVSPFLRDPSDATTAMRALKPLEISWQDQQNHLGAGSKLQALDVVLADTNLDGKDEAIRASERTDPQAQTPETPFCLKTGDFNGDGKKDTFKITVGDTSVSLGTIEGASMTFSEHGKTQFASYFLDPTIGPQEHLLLQIEGYAIASRVTVGDFNGDGRDDILVHGFDGRIHVFYSTGTAFLDANDDDAAHAPFLHGEGDVMWAVYWKMGGAMPRMESSVEDHSYVRPMPCDLNGDGLTDYVCLTFSRYIKFIADRSFIHPTGLITFRACTGVLARPDGSFSAPFQIGGPAMSVPIETNETAANTNGTIGSIKVNDINTGMLPGDFNGDGLTDFLVLVPEFEHQSPTLFSNFYGGHRWVLYLNEGAPANSVPTFAQYNGPIENDYNLGGGVTANSYYTPILSDGNGVLTSPISFFRPQGEGGSGAAGIAFYTALEGGGGSTNNFVMDVNHDGLADLVWYVAVQKDTELDAGAAKGWYAMLSTGKFPSDHPFVGPVKLDYLKDIVGPTPVVPTRGAGGNPHFDSTVITHDFDFDGDGHPDYLVQPSNNGRPQLSKVHLATNGADEAPEFPDLVHQITDGLGRVTEIAYKAAKDDSVYTAAAVAPVYPIHEIRSAAPVVSKVYHDTGGVIPAPGSTDPDERAIFTYQYSGNMLDLSGRGSLGFHSFVTYDQQTQLFKYQFLAQSFPMTGLAQREETYRSVGDNKFNILSSHTNTIVFDKVGGSSGPTLWPFISQAIEYRWEDGAALVTPTLANPESLFSANRHLTKAHIKITAQSTFDGQASPMLDLPASLVTAGFHPSDVTETFTSDPGSDTTATHHVVGAQSFAAFASLGGSITRGNLTQLKTEYSDGAATTAATDTETVSTIYDDTTPLGIANRVKSVATTVTSAVGTQKAPTKTFGYYGDTALVTKETLSNDAVNSAFDLVTDYDRTTDSVRHRVKMVTVTGKNLLTQNGQNQSIVTARTEAFNNRFDLPTEVKDAYDNKTITVYHPFLGKPTSVTDANAITISTTYDALGRPTNVTKALKVTDSSPGTIIETTSTTIAQDVSVSIAPPDGLTDKAITDTSAYRTDVTATARPPVTTYFDRLGRPLRSKKTGYKDAVALTDTLYNKLGQTVATSLPYVDSPNPTKLWTTMEYDPLGRVKTQIAPNGTVTTSSYTGRATAVTVDAPLLDGVNPAAQTNTTLVNAKGQTVSVWNADNVPSFSDNLGTTSTTPSVSFDLDGFGRMIATHLKGLPDTQTIKADYDPLGRQTELNDPDKGDWKYENSPLGYVLKQTDARQTVTTTSYDKLGRPITRITTEAGTGAPVETASWHFYDSAADASTHHVTFTDKGWIGALQREELSIANGLGYAQTAALASTSTVHYYDDRGRPSIDLTTIDDKWFYTYLDYDDTLNLVKNIRHYWRPAGAQSPTVAPYLWQNFGYTYNYTDKGYVTSITDLNDLPGATVRTWWKADESDGYDHLDRPVHFTKGSGYETTRTYRPADGVLTGIVTTGAGSAKIQNLSFSYDGLGNLVGRGIVGGPSETLGYDSLNRVITSDKPGGSATYYDDGNIRTRAGVSGGDYSYTATNKPHAVRNAGGFSMDYDANGNLSSRTNSATGESWQFSYPGFDKPRWMARTIAADTKGSEFLYNANRSRIIQLEFEALSAAPGNYVRKRIYAYGSTLELNYTKAPSATDWGLDKIRVYVPGPDGIVGSREFSPKKTSGSPEDAYIYHTDHLGSTDVVTKFDATAGVAADKTGKPGLFSETAWGQRRNPATWSGAPTATDDGGADSLTPRGFTGHEMLDDLGLVHMNGRIYDPLLGRFLSADTLVQFQGDLQSYNRYSYVRNNPLTATDPSGFGENWWDAAKELWQNIRPNRTTLDADSIHSAENERIESLPLGPNSDKLITAARESAALAPAAAGGVAHELVNTAASFIQAAASGPMPMPGITPLQSVEEMREFFNGRIDGLVTERIVANGGNPDGIGRAIGDLTGSTAAQAGMLILPMAGEAALEFRAATLTERFAFQAETVTLDANSIRFSQSSVKPALGEYVAKMEEGGWFGAPIDVVRMSDGGLTSIDNTRLAAASITKTPVQAVIRDAGAAFPPSRGPQFFGGATTWGQAALNRINSPGNNALWKRLYPSGSPFTGIRQGAGVIKP